MYPQKTGRRGRCREEGGGAEPDALPRAAPGVGVAEVGPTRGPEWRWRVDDEQQGERSPQ